MTVSLLPLFFADHGARFSPRHSTKTLLPEIRSLLGVAACKLPPLAAWLEPAGAVTSRDATWEALQHPHDMDII